MLVQVHASNATFGTSDGQRRRLSGWVDIGADQSLAENGEQAALGLLATLGALVDEAVDGGGSDGS